MIGAERSEGRGKERKAWKKEMGSRATGGSVHARVQDFKVHISQGYVCTFSISGAPLKRANW